MVRSSAIPYGYTVTIWTSGAAIESSHGTPTVADAFLFVLGAMAGFAVLSLVTQVERDPPLQPHRGDLIRTGLIQVVAVGLALGAVALVALIHSLAVWPVGAFVATLVYLAGAGVELALTSRAAEHGSDAS